MTLDEYLADLAAKAEKATPGPWVHCFGTYTKDTLVRTDTGFDHTYIANVRSRENGYQDAAHIAAFSADAAAALVAVAKAAQSFMRLYESAKQSRNSNTSFVDTRDLESTAAEARTALSRLTALARTR